MSWPIFPFSLIFALSYIGPPIELVSIHFKTESNINSFSSELLCEPFLDEPIQSIDSWHYLETGPIDFSEFGFRRCQILRRIVRQSSEHIKVDFSSLLNIRRITRLGLREYHFQTTLILEMPCPFHQDGSIDSYSVPLGSCEQCKTPISFHTRMIISEKSQNMTITKIDCHSLE